MKFDIITLFPEMFQGPLSESIIKRAREKELIEINYHNLRGFALDKHKTVDDTPYGGGKGMLLKVDVVDRAIRSIELQVPSTEYRVRKILLTPQGIRLNQDKVQQLARDYDNLILICGHYEGFDERIREHLIDEEISIGDFVLTGGELPAMILVDAVSRMVPGVLSKGSSNEESFMQKDSNGKYLKEYPQYTKPDNYNDWSVPEILKSGDHKKIANWRNNMRKY
ncbi:tRNA (guanosine(37)-N1)-methyltransferase TrmD [Candidatus Berkelbacteria bacterium CG10_big_fil_rev_8_21_14_0_10_43_13]|uniref:tRNA (guanine-N(1)-)-methyltransferase n=1 Tax=Candidatus Berkelbacteria bacterium CG10_big_fil_rev_8_21_14_0_10_43_13 TaxID=1974514 RepID=A0A2H0W7E4_9BACT|nr:MAG: tRNA (guanosine(37)-N1)-methyltransferase TrmD [Candidatus Berkelbacteria bacterium CG10_big_fil_rev_8_21_14_0_10_43_13]